MSIRLPLLIWTHQRAALDAHKFAGVEHRPFDSVRPELVPQRRPPWLKAREVQVRLGRGGRWRAGVAVAAAASWPLLAAVLAPRWRGRRRCRDAHPHDLGIVVLVGLPVRAHGAPADAHTVPLGGFGRTLWAQASGRLVLARMRFGPAWAELAVLSSPVVVACLALAGRVTGAAGSSNGLSPSSQGARIAVWPAIVRVGRRA